MTHADPRRPSERPQFTLRSHQSPSSCYCSPSTRVTGQVTGVGQNGTDRAFTAARGFGALVRQHRLAASLSQEDLAERSRLSVATIAAIERGRSKTPRPATVLLLAQALGLTDEEWARLIDAVAHRRPSPATSHFESRVAVSSPVAIRHNLPPSLSRFVGRREDLAHVQHALAGARLVTLMGTGGVGKTRLALEVARHIAGCDAPRYPAGIWRVELAPVADGGSIARALTAALGVREVPGREPLETVTQWLRKRRLLLLLDNCEHLISDCADVVSALLEECPGVSILATSREALNVPGEVVYPVRPLEADSDALELFADLATRISPGFVLTPDNRACTIRVCQRLDGLPLAIELAAARVNVLTVQEMEHGLDQRFVVLGPARRPSTPRHQTLRALVDWSYDLLSPPEQQLFQQLSVFAGGWTLDAAADLCGEGTATVLPLLGNLVEKSLVQVEQRDGASRYRLLETLREYAADKLRRTGDEHVLRTRHLHWCERLARAGDAGLSGPDHRTWLARLEAEVDNFRAALRWSLLEPSELHAGLRTAGLLVRLWFLGGASAEGVEWLTALLANAPENAARVEALSSAGFLLVRRGDPERARPLLEEAVMLARRLGHPYLVAVALNHLGEMYVQVGDIAGAKRALEESLALNTGGVDWPVFWPPYVGLYNLGEVAELEGDPDAAAEIYRRSIDLASAQHDGFRTTPLRLLAQLAIDRGDLAAARELLTESLIVARDWVKGWTAAPVLLVFAKLALAENQPERTLRLAGAAVGQREERGERLQPTQVARLEPVLNKARRMIPADVAATAWAEGYGMSLDVAVAYALETGAPAQTRHERPVTCRTASANNK
jgi:predicted ATPase/transcriptional regulator with XRE-family HTH domain